MRTLLIGALSAILAGCSCLNPAAGDAGRVHLEGLFLQNRSQSAG